MTEAEWLAGTHPWEMLEYVRGQASDRKIRLFELAFLRFKYRFQTSGWARTAVDIAERKVKRGFSKIEEFSAQYHRLQSVAHFEIGQHVEYSTLLHFDIFGNPFRPITFLPEWRTSTVTTLAQQMYVTRDFSVMPILADAIQDAGCDDTEILNHCRDPMQVHVRGCWVVDLILGKE